MIPLVEKGRCNDEEGSGSSCCDQYIIWSNVFTGYAGYFFPEPGMAHVVTIEQCHILHGKSKVRYLSVPDRAFGKVVTDEIISELFR